MWRSIADLSAKRWKCGLVELGGYLYAVGGMDSPRAGFWGAPLNTGRHNKHTFILRIYLIFFIPDFQLRDIAHEPTNGRQRNQCMKVDLAVLLLLIWAKSMLVVALVRIKPFCQVWNVMILTLTR